jgi:DNA-binding beta-propeller fold protein YncE
MRIIQRIKSGCRAAGIAPFCVLLALCAIACSSCGTGKGKVENADYIVGANRSPWGMALNEDGSLLFVANNGYNTVEVYNADTMASVASVRVICGPRYLAFSRDYTKLYVTHDSDSMLESNSCSISSYDPSQVRRVGSYVSVIDIAQMKVVKEINISTETTQITNPRNITLDTLNNIFYIVSQTTTGIVTTLDADDDEVLGGMSVYSSSSNKAYNIEFDPEKGVGYMLEPANSRINVFNAVDFREDNHTVYTFNGQTQGYCAGTSGNKNSCACSANSNCHSGYCDQSYILPMCAAACSGSTANRSGCPCAQNSNCSSGICENNLCVTPTIIGLSSVRGYCDTDTGICSTPAQMGMTSPTCRDPRGMLLMSDDTMYVSCYGASTGASALQPLLRIILDEDGIASSNTAVATEQSFLACLRPTLLAKDPSEKHVFLLCSGNATTLIIDAASGSPIGGFSVPANPTHIVASDDYVFVTSAASGAIHRHPLR